MAETEFLQIRLTPENRQHLSRVAEAYYLDEPTWARRAIAQALECWDAERQHGEIAAEAKPAEKHRVAESKAPSQSKPQRKRKPRE